MKPSRKEIVKAIRLTWESLDSHLADAALDRRDNAPKEVGKPPFHRKCVKEYAFVIDVLARML